MNEKLPTYGGQAVIEGVMMRGSKGVAIAMRAPNSEIVIHTEQLSGIYKTRLAKIPFLRGLVALWDALGLGVRALTISANTQVEDEGQKMEGPQLWISLAISMVIGISMFFLAPAAVGQFGELNFQLNSWWSNLMEGAFRLFVLVAYIGLISLLPDIRKVFAYHGAEHKTINAFEDGAELTPENVARYSLQHPRCGTAFLLTLALVSVIFFSLLGSLPLEIRLLSRVAFIPILAGISYEYIRWTGSHVNTPIVRWLVKPGLLLQRLTTREPSLEIIEVSIAAFNAMRVEETAAQPVSPVLEPGLAP